MNLVKPRRLKKGDTIRIVAPASNMCSLSKQAVGTGVKNLESLGFNVELHPDIYRSYKGTAGKPEERARSLMEAFMVDSVDGVMCCWGGFNSNDILDHLDFSVFNESPKVFIGYSDITILNTVLYQKAGMINFQGPAFITFTHDFLMPWEVQVFKDVLMTPSDHYELHASTMYIDDPYFYKHPDIPVKRLENSGWNVVREGHGRGRLIGGHLGTLLCLAGTDYWPSLKNHLLFIECDEEDLGPRNVSRQLRHLQQLGVFENISGLLVGRIPSVLGLKGDQSIESLLEDVIERDDLPVVTQMDFGHTNPIATIPVGAKAELSTENKVLTLFEAGVH